MDQGSRTPKDAPAGAAAMVPLQRQSQPTTSGQLQLERQQWPSQWAQACKASICRKREVPQAMPSPGHRSPQPPRSIPTT